MRILADENFPRESVSRLRNAGHDVTWVGESSPSSPDDAVLSIACREARIALTFDRDFGELVYRRRLPSPPGIVYLRFVPSSPTHAADVVLGLIARQDITIEGHFTVVRLDEVRQRPLPRAE